MNDLHKNELLDLRPTVIDLEDVKGGMFLPSRFPLRSSTYTMTNSGDSSDLATQFFTADNIEML